MVRRVHRIVKWTLGLLALAAGLFIVWNLGRVVYKFVRPDPVPVTVYRLTRGTVEETVTNSKAGTVKARRRARISPEVGGRVAFIGFRPGARVRKGDVLLRINDRDLTDGSFHKDKAPKRSEHIQVTVNVYEVES